MAPKFWMTPALVTAALAFIVISGTVPASAGTHHRHYYGAHYYGYSGNPAMNPHRDRHDDR
jgi:hypothetical protein